jgi:16S rRNA (adenine1518-N6/adenine1519-N6)-dimethyltransferase
MKAKKALSQFFLKDKLGLQKIAAALGDITNETVVEIGGGHGELSRFLTQAKRLIIYEIDQGLTSVLQEKFSSLPNIEIRQENFLSAQLEKFNHQYSLVGNIPYHLSGLILRKILDKRNFPQIAVLTFQKEYGERLLGLPKPNFLSNWVKIFAEPKRVMLIKRKSFVPSPKVDSITIKISFFSNPLTDQPESFANFLKRLFYLPNRKLKQKLPSSILSLQPQLKNLRAHQLTLSEILELYRAQSELI